MNLAQIMLIFIVMCEIGAGCFLWMTCFSHGFKAQVDSIVTIGLTCVFTFLVGSLIYVLTHRWSELGQLYM